MPRFTARPGLRALVLLAAVSSVAACSATSVARKRWVELSRGDVTILTPATAADASKLANDVDTFRAALASLSRIAPPEMPTPLRVVVFTSRAQLRPFVPSPDVAGMQRTTIDGEVLMLQGDDEESRRVLYHELVHSFLRESGAQYPSWYEEGLAEFLGTARIERDVVELGRPPARWGLYAVKALRTGVHQQASTGSHLRPSATLSPDLLYALRWAMVDLLLLGHLASPPEPDRRAQLAELLRLLNAGVAEPEALDRALGMTRDELEEQAALWVIDDRFPLVRVRVPSVAPARGPAARPAPPARVACTLAELSEAVGRPAQARSLYELAATAEPARGCGPAGLASLLSSEGSRAEATLLLDELVQRPGGDADAETAYGWHLLEPALHAFAAGEPFDAAAIDAAREHFRRALALDPASLRAQWGLGATYVPSTTDVGPGITALETAVARGTTHPLVYYYLGALHARSGHPGRARRYLEAARRMAASSGIGRAAARDLAALEGGATEHVFGRG